MQLFTYLSINQIDTTVTDDAGVAVTNADVVITITDRAGTEAPGETWPATMTHVADGVYRYTTSVELAEALAEWTRWKANITADVGGSPRFSAVPILVLADSD